jgi:hypothetical protein
MLTVKEFRSQYSLSESQFKRVRSLADERSGSPVVERKGAKDYVIVNQQAILDVMAEYDNGSLLRPVEPQVIEAELEPDHPATQSSIQLLSTDKLSALDSIANLANGLEVYKRPEIVLNGAQDEAVGMVTELATRVLGMKTTNDQREQALQERKQNLDKIQATVQHLANVGKSQEWKADDINAEAKTLAATELELKKQLAELLNGLS